MGMRWLSCRRVAEQMAGYARGHGLVGFLAWVQVVARVVAGGELRWVVGVAQCTVEVYAAVKQRRLT